VKVAVVASLVRCHRAIFVAATAMLGVGASEVAAGSGAARHWLLLGGSAVVMFVGDTLSSVDGRARTLAAGSNVPISEARSDVFGQMRPRVITMLAIVGVVSTAAGFTVPLPSASTTPATTGSHLRCVSVDHRSVLRVFKCALAP
jgi:hypothetical protein